jgi:GGDEF domain-containing protein
MVNDDGLSLTIVHTSYTPNLIRRVEKLIRASAIGYRFAFAPDSNYARNIATGKKIYVQRAKEFVTVMLPKDMHLLVERIRTGVAEFRVKTDAEPASVTLSIGIAETIHSPQDESVENIIHRADEAMYAAKKAGRNRSVIFDADVTGVI